MFKPGSAAPPFGSSKSAAPASMSTMPAPMAAAPPAVPMKAKAKKKPPNHSKPTKGAFKSDTPKDRSDKGPVGGY